MKFQIICCDPPFRFYDQLKQSNVKRGASSNYNTMSIDDIKKLDIKSVVDPDGCLLALWVPSALLQDGLDIMKSWGFTQKQTYIWIKSKKDNFIDFKSWIKKNILNKPQISYDEFSYKRAVQCIIESIDSVNLINSLGFFMGRIFRQTHEICLIGINNNGIYKKLSNRSRRSVCFAENLKHSAKPEALQDSLELMFPGQNYLELFGRRSRNKWTVIGNEAPATLGQDIRISLSKLY